jgi:nicotinamidase-related amidase
MTSALVLIDLQNDFFANDELALCRADLVQTCNGLVERAHRAGVLVVEVHTVHEADGSTWALNMRDDDQGMAIRGTEGAAPVPGLLGGQVTLEKTRDSAFHRTDLERLLARHGIERIVLAGVSTESCISATATDAYARDLRVTLVSDATASMNREWHVRTLSGLTQLYRQAVVESSAVSLDDL